MITQAQALLSGAACCALLSVPAFCEPQISAAPAVSIAQPELRFEAGELWVTAPASKPGLLLIGSKVPSQDLRLGLQLELTVDQFVPFRTDAMGQARVQVPASAYQFGNQVQVVVMDEQMQGPLTIFGARSLSGSSNSQAVTSSAGASGAVGVAGVGAISERDCAGFCPTCEDSPDADFKDSNCDGLDGNVALAIFVDALNGSIDGAGTQADPISDLQLAIDLAAVTPDKQHVYVSLGDYSGPIVLADGVSVWGGFDAADGWSRAANHEVTIHNLDVTNSAEGVIGLRGANIHSETTVGDLTVEVWGGGMNQTGSGEHVFAIHLQQVSSLSFERVTAIGAYAGYGNRGSDGSLTSGHYLGGSGGAGGTSSALPKSGKSGNGSTCGLGGLGGLGGAPFFGGFNGVVGVFGTPGFPSSSTPFASVSISGAQLNMGGNGASGGSGCRGGAGGGGGGGGYALFIGNGGKGGKGGNGGNGGGGGTGGKRGGCSVAVFLSSAHIEASDCTFVAERGGHGGFGGLGASGKVGSNGSNGQSVSGPNGGDGGKGGTGGPGLAGAPGAGGHCYAVLSSSSSSASLSQTNLSASLPGPQTISIPLGAAGEAVPFKQL